ncbi:MAG: hypothetical protein PWP10_4062 [Clostridiales bacterium]|jgi:hypothetical protein|nr:hypothetical protein [Clostridiales bacterium]
MDNYEQLNQWLDDIEGFRQAEWDKLPDIGLYMDQVQTYIERQLSAFTRNEKDKLLTPAMINNYIKDNLIPRAEAKKYSSSHVALLIMIATLKQVLSMQNLKNMLADCRDQEQVQGVYAHYLQHQQNDLHSLSVEITNKINKDNTQWSVDHEYMRLLALELSIEARNRILMSEKILEYMQKQSEDDEKPKEEKQKKEK